MINILISYMSMNIGGSTTSLIGLLHSLDYTKYQVDLQLYENNGPYMKFIPEKVNILPQARILSKNLYIGKVQRMSHPIYWKEFFKSFYYKNKYPNSLAVNQVLSFARAKVSRKNNKKYDVAIGFLEMWPNYYVLQHINAKRKIAWIHVDYEKSGLVADIERDLYQNFEKVVLVSLECLNSFKKIFPEYAKKSYFLENILNKDFIIKRSKLENNYIKKENIINFGTVCRIEFRHKGLDRALLALKKAKDKGYKFVWHIIGEGTDFTKLLSLIKEYKMEKEVILYGSKSNPLPYVKQFDIFLLPSLYEGKPMAITEAQMLGIPAVVTNYNSASEQIRNEFDGLIMENSEMGILNGIIKILDNPFYINVWRENLKNKKWDYSKVINKFDKILTEEL